MYPGERLRFDILNPICMFLLCALGLLFVYSAQISYDGGHWKRQLFFIMAGIGIYSLVSALNYKIFLQYFIECFTYINLMLNFFKSWF